jgi:xylulokinase
MATTGAGAEITALPTIAKTIDPVAALTEAFDEGHARYRAAATAIKGLT